jgi:hypothetical protein
MQRIQMSLGWNKQNALCEMRINSQYRHARSRRLVRRNCRHATPRTMHVRASDKNSIELAHTAVVVLENVLSTGINIRTVSRGSIRSLEKMRHPATHSVCMRTGVRLIGRYPARHAFSRPSIQKRLCEVEFVHEVVQAGADSGFDWLHWPRYVATGAQGSMYAALARQPAEVVHTARHEDVCAQQEKGCTKPTHKTREDPL